MNIIIKFKNEEIYFLYIIYLSKEILIKKKYNALLKKINIINI